MRARSSPSRKGSRDGASRRSLRGRAHSARDVRRRRRSGVARRRGGGHAQVPVAFLLRHTTVVDLTHPAAKVLARMLGATRTRDPIDAHIVLLARERGWPVLSSDPEDLSAIDPGLTIQAI